MSAPEADSHLADSHLADALRMEPPASASDRDRVRRSYTIRQDQDLALGMALTEARLGRTRIHGTTRNEIIEALLDLHGYNQDYVDGTTKLR